MPWRLFTVFWAANGADRLALAADKEALLLATFAQPPPYLCYNDG